MTKVPLTANNSIPTHTSTPGRCSLPNSRRPRPAPLRGSHAAAASPPLDPCPTQSDARRSEPTPQQRECLPGPRSPCQQSPGVLDGRRARVHDHREKHSTNTREHLEHLYFGAA